MNLQENSFEGLKPSGYYNTAIYDEDGNILELRIMKNALTKWFAINIALYLLSRGRKFTQNGVDYYVVTPTLMVTYDINTLTHFWYLSDNPRSWNNNQAFHQIAPNYPSVQDPSGGGFSGVIYLTTLDPPSLASWDHSPSIGNFYSDYRINVSTSSSIGIHHYQGTGANYNTPYLVGYFTPIDCYSSTTGLTLDLTGAHVTASIRGNYNFNSNYSCKCILTFSGGRPAESQYAVSSGSPPAYQANIANILTFRPFQVNFTAGQTISVEWKVVIQI